MEEGIRDPKVQRDRIATKFCCGIDLVSRCFAGCFRQLLEEIILYGRRGQAKKRDGSARFLMAASDQLISNIQLVGNTASIERFSTNDACPDPLNLVADSSKPLRHGVMNFMGQTFTLAVDCLYLPGLEAKIGKLNQQS